MPEQRSEFCSEHSGLNAKMDNLCAIVAKIEKQLERMWDTIATLSKRPSWAVTIIIAVLSSATFLALGAYLTLLSRLAVKSARGG